MSIRPFVLFVICAFILFSCTSPVPNYTLQESTAEEPATTQQSSPSLNGASNQLAGNRFTKKVLVDNLYEPTEFELLDDGTILFTQRRGELLLFDPEEKQLLEVAKLNVHTKFEDGLMGLALDPNFEDNNWLYLYYSPASSNPNSDKEDYVPTKEESKQHLSRFVFKDGVLDMDSEVLMLEVQTQRVECCHTGGSIEFGPNGNLFLSTGDDVNPFASDGFGPIDEQPGRSPWDGQTTSANTNDLRGKILRITPQADGSYTIPEGNLFPEGTPKTRPEIYVMGNRNPYRISIDQKTGYLYWGEVGPDANENDPNRGPRGHDEVNQARQAGNFGWPLFVADNKAYNDYDFATMESGAQFDPMAPINDSPNNTGLRELPPAQKAFIWYPYAESPEFPMLGSGGRNAMAGPVFYRDAFELGPHSLPEEYDGRLFIYDWIRGWIMTVTMDENSDLVEIEPFMPGVEFSSPIDMQINKEGVLYVLEYGKGWFSQNEDAGIVRIELNNGSIAASQESDDEAGNQSNSLPQVKISLEGNQSFYFGDESRPYEVLVMNGEDSSLEVMQVEDDDVIVQMDYLPIGYDQTLIAQGHQLADETSQRLLEGKRLIEGSDCASCHTVELDYGSIGPSYTEVAEKYADQEDVKPYLMGKIKNGGGGVWGEQPMAAHPQFSDEELGAIVEYILSVGDESEASKDNLGATGILSFDDHLANESNQGMYIVRATYTVQDRNSAASSTSETTLTLRHPRVQAESSDASELTEEVNKSIALYSGSYLGFKDIDLTSISSLKFFVKPSDESTGGIIEARLGSPEGRSVGQIKFDTSQLEDEGEELSMSFGSTEGKHDLYFVTKNDATTETTLFLLDWIQFGQ